MRTRALGGYAGLALAICVPALVVAQSFPPTGFPPRFNPGDVLSAPALDAMRQGIVDLNSRLTRTGVGASPTQPIVVLGPNRQTATAETRADGILTVITSGSGFDALVCRIVVGNATLGRANGGASGTVAISRGTTINLNVDVPAGNVATCSVYWTSLEGPSALAPTVQ